MGLPPSEIHELRTLVLSFHPAIAIESADEERIGALLKEVARQTGLPIFEWSLTRGLTQGHQAPSHGTTANPQDMLSHLRGLTVEGIFWLKDLPRHLEDPRLAREFRDIARSFSHSCSAMILSAPEIELPPDIDSGVVHFTMAPPSLEELREAVMTVIGSIRKRQSVAVDLTASDLDRLIDSLRGMSCGQARQAVARVMIEDDRLNAEDIETIRTHKARSLSKEGLLEFFPAQDNNVELGGFEGLKTWLERARMGFGPAAREWNLDPPRGVMLTGVQGCGKSLAARAVASSWGLPLLKLDAGRLYDKYYGASEKNLRRAIELAESMAPAVLWIDEIEKGFASFGSSDGHDGVSQRIFATLLTWLQEKKESVFVVATANDIFRLPPELLRKGRFDEIFFVDLPVASERETILRIHMERRRQNPEVFNLQALVAASDGMSGAEIEQAVVAALYGALHDACLLDTEGLLGELKATVPLSVSRREDLERLRALATNRFVPVRGATRTQPVSS